MIIAPPNETVFYMASQELVGAENIDDLKSFIRSNLNDGILVNSHWNVRIYTIQYQVGGKSVFAVYFFRRSLWGTEIFFADCMRTLKEVKETYGSDDNDPDRKKTLQDIMKNTFKGGKWVYLLFKIGESILGRSSISDEAVPSDGMPTANSEPSMKSDLYSIERSLDGGTQTEDAAEGMDSLYLDNADSATDLVLDLTSMVMDHDLDASILIGCYGAGKTTILVDTALGIEEDIVFGWGEESHTSDDYDNAVAISDYNQNSYCSQASPSLGRDFSTSISAAVVSYYESDWSYNYGRAWRAVAANNKSSDALGRVANAFCLRHAGYRYAPETESGLPLGYGTYLFEDIDETEFRLWGGLEAEVRALKQEQNAFSLHWRREQAVRGDICSLSAFVLGLREIVACVAAEHTIIDGAWASTIPYRTSGGMLSSGANAQRLRAFVIDRGSSDGLRDQSVYRVQGAALPVFPWWNNGAYDQPKAISTALNEDVKQAVEDVVGTPAMNAGCAAYSKDTLEPFDKHSHNEFRLKPTEQWDLETMFQCELNPKLGFEDAYGEFEKEDA